LTSSEDRAAPSRRFDGAHARQYDDRIRTAVPGYEALHEVAGSLLRRLLGQRARLLVVGSGTGEEIARLGGHNPGWSFVGADSSPDMVAVCRERVAEAGLSERVELHTGPVQELHDSTRYDAATSILVLHFLPDDGEKLALLESVAARLEPGAPFLLADMHGDRRSDRFADLFDAWKHWQVLAGILEEDVGERLQSTLADVHFVPERRISELLTEAGFGDIERFYGALLFGGWMARKASSPGKA